ncbi:polyketide synthase [Candidatus Magnetomorum sp. HK-1]|nr:polyketide synthase [Candidatus Magnetomorum sp. HK-1]
MLILDINHPVLKHHRVFDQELLPGLAYIDLLFQIFHEKGFDFKSIALKNLSIHKPLIVGKQLSVLLSMQSETIDDNTFNIRLEGKNVKNGNVGDDTTCYVTCEMHKVVSVCFDETIDIEQIKLSASSVLDFESIYEKCRQYHMVHTGFMKAEGKVFITDTGILIDIFPGPDGYDDIENIMFHPTLIDASGAASGKMLSSLVDDPDKLFLPLHFESFTASSLIQKKCLTYIKHSSLKRKNELLYQSMDFFDESGKKIAELKNFVNKLVRNPGQINPEKKQSDCVSTQLPQSIPKKMPVLTKADDKQLPEQHSDNTSSHDDLVVSVKFYLCQLMAEILDVSPHDIQTDIGYYEMGLDSSGLLNIVQKIEQKLNSTIPPTLLFEYSTIDELAVYLLNEYPNSFSEIRKLL